MYTQNLNRLWVMVFTYIVKFERCRYSVGEEPKMRYPGNYENIIDVTKPPYSADNTGKTDCTHILQKIFDDILSREVVAVQ